MSRPSDDPECQIDQTMQGEEFLPGAGRFDCGAALPALRAVADL
ncbi:MAG TPA: hypothetical protein PKE45_07295 [Caldilineaceae bacterium]|nr:hypothetical protein [Caldilineaceae bacterium]